MKIIHEGHLHGRDSDNQSSDVFAAIITKLKQKWLSWNLLKRITVERKQTFQLHKHNFVVNFYKPLFNLSNK